MEETIQTVNIAQPLRRHIAVKLRIGTILAGKQVMDGERLKHLLINENSFVRVNIIANIVDKYVQEGERRYGTLTLDDASGQIRVKLFGDAIERFQDIQQGDTVLVVGLLRVWHNELYITPEIIRKKEPAFLLVRKLELEQDRPKEFDSGAIAALKEKILTMIKDAEKDGGLGIDEIILTLKESPQSINQEIKRLLEEGVAYEPRPGRLRYLG